MTYPKVHNTKTQWHKLVESLGPDLGLAQKIAGLIWLIDSTPINCS